MPEESKRLEFINTSIVCERKQHRRIYKDSFGSALSRSRWSVCGKGSSTIEIASSL